MHQSPKRTGKLSIRQGPWKLIFGQDEERELYNLQSDLSETKNVASAHVDVVKRLEKLMRSYIERGRSTPGPVQKNDVDLSLDYSGRKKK